MAGAHRRPLMQASLALLAGCSPGEPGAGAEPTQPGEAATPAPVSARIPRLLAAYPDHLAGVERDTLLWRDGTRMPIGAGLPARPFEAMLRSATIADQLRQAYAPGPAPGPPPRDHSPGRLRNTGFFLKMYGDCHAGAVPWLRTVTWMPRTRPQALSVTTVNDVAGRLERVVEALEGLPDRVKAHLVPSAGAYACRAVADTGLPSMHAFGAAIDIAPRRSEYWAWSRSRGGRPDPGHLPWEIVEAFEAERFIWGGKWFHYDDMHFEYRPELFG